MAIIDGQWITPDKVEAYLANKAAQAEAQSATPATTAPVDLEAAKAKAAKQAERAATRAAAKEAAEAEARALAAQAEAEEQAALEAFMAQDEAPAEPAEPSETEDEVIIAPGPTAAEQAQALLAGAE